MGQQVIEAKIQKNDKHFFRIKLYLLVSFSVAFFIDINNFIT